ncbi:rhodanese-related sulfurtransferase [Oceaniglobus indicus]|uniref:oxygen-dependent tRNA uridine(34) hydroxylase TrhO n=1 Tax=Oceaniglobus indicus TaxID=2047749 RepID=UPI000C17C918|nr:rhodanese-related sulfurtransferase [Oceaniglobus indicus]
MFTVAALYRFTRLDAPASLRAPLADVCNAHGVKGILLLAPEGINGTIGGTRAGIDAVLAHIRTLPGCADLDWKESTAADMPFLRMKVRLKREIVTMGQPDIDPVNATGTHVDAADWNALIDAPDVVVIDTRNAYETAIGTFQGAIDPATESFGSFPAWWQANSDRLQGKRIAMFCTGGIRCEKSTAYLRAQGVPEVFHLKGGILKYLETVPESESRWQGECFVFDQRVAVKHGLQQGDHTLCHGCRHPVSPAEREHPAYEPGVACPHCADTLTQTDRARFRERQRQIELARARGERHLGS